MVGYLGISSLYMRVLGCHIETGSSRSSAEARMCGKLGWLESFRGLTELRWVSGSMSQFSTWISPHGCWGCIMAWQLGSKMEHSKSKKLAAAKPIQRLVLEMA